MLGPNEVFNSALRVYRNHGWTYLRLTLIPAIFCLAGVAFLLEFILPSIGETRNAHSVTVQLGEATFAMALAIGVAAPLFLIGFSYTSALVIRLTSDALLGNPIDLDAAVKANRSSFGALLVVALRELFIGSLGAILGALVLGLGAYLSDKGQSSDAGGFLFVLGSLGLAVGAGLFLYVVCVHSLAPAIAVLENKGGWEASKRSSQLLKAQLNHPSGTPSFFVCIVYLAVAGGIEWGGLALGFNFLQAGQHVEGFLSGSPFAAVLVAGSSMVAPFVTIWTLLPIYATCITLVYYERRIRLEGLDIEVLAAEIDRAGAANRFDV